MSLERKLQRLLQREADALHKAWLRERKAVRDSFHPADMALYRLVSNTNMERADVQRAVRRRIAELGVTP